MTGPASSSGSDLGPGTGLTVGLLGPVIVSANGARREIPRTGQRILLAMLALTANKPVSTEALIDAVWSEEPSRQRERNLHVQMYQLRRLLAGLEPDRAQPRIVTAAPGYRLFMADADVDSAVFAGLVERGRTAARGGDPHEAARLLTEGLALWRGPALADIAGSCPRLSGVADRLEEQRLAALEDRIAADLTAGSEQAGTLAAELAGLVAANPLRERLRGQLMLALYRAGRQADALEAFRQGRQILTEELGLDPGPELADLHQRILAADPKLAGQQRDELMTGQPPGLTRVSAPRGSAGNRQVAHADAGSSADKHGAAIPRQLPADQLHFVGRSDELLMLDGLLVRLREPQTDDMQGSGVVAVLGGTAGIGKTTLAIHWAHSAGPEFPDGQLYADLRGYHPAGLPATSAEVIRGFLDALGVPDSQVPASTDGQASLYRTLLAGRRILMVLDDARDAAQVRPLLPSSRHSFVVVTSRSALPGLTVTNGAVPIILGLPGVDEATRLLAARVGQERLEAEPAAATDLVSLCARLPLAIAVTAARAAAQPGHPLAALAAQLESQHGRLDVLDTGDPASTLRDVFACSCQHLAPPAASMFRLLGLHPGPDVSVAAAASLAGWQRGRARQALAELLAASLVTEAAPGRFAMHDLLRTYAAEQAMNAESAADREKAALRLLDYYLHSAAAAARQLHPGFPRVVLAEHVGEVVPEQFATVEEAGAWFRAEHQVLLAAIAHAAESGYHSHAWQLPILVANTWVRQGQFDDLATASRLALAAATALGDPQALAMAHERMANVCFLDGSYDAAVGHAERALTQFRLAHDVIGEADAHARLGWALSGQQQYQQALVHARSALRLHRQEGNRSGEASALRLAGSLHAQQSDFVAARGYYEQALAAYQEVGGVAGQADAWDNLGHAHFQLGEYEAAVHSHKQAAAMSAAAGHRRGHVHSLIRLGDAYSAAGQHSPARACWSQALELLGNIRHPDADRIRAALADGEPTSSSDSP